MSESPSNGAPQPGSRKRLSIWLAGLLALLIGIIWLLGGFDREPTYLGKRASIWLDDESAQPPVPPFASRTLPANVRLQVVRPMAPAAQFALRQRGWAGGWTFRPIGTSPPQTTKEAFKAMGDKGVSFLIRTIRHKPSPLLVKFLDFIDENNVPMSDWMQKHLPDPDHIEERRSKALTVIGELGAPVANAAIPELARVFTDPAEEDDFRELAGQALKNMGATALPIQPQLIDALKSTNEEIQVLSARILGTIGPKASASIPALRLAAQTTQDDQLDFAAAEALWKIDRETNILIQVCSNLLAGVDTELRCNALAALAPLEAQAKALSPGIQSALGDPDERVRWEAEKALRQIDPAALASVVNQINQDLSGQVSRIVPVLTAQDGTRISAATRALAVLGPKAARAVPALIKVLDREAVRINAALPGLRSTIVVSNFLAGSNFIVLTNRAGPMRGPLVASGSGRVMAGWTSYSPPAASPYRGFRFGGDGAMDCAEALAEIGPEARAATPRLTALLREPSSFARAAYCKALGAIGPDAKEAVPDLEAILKNRAANDQLAAAEALARIAPEQSSNAIVVLRRIMQYGYSPGTPGYANELRAATALWRLGLQPNPPVDALIKACEADGNVNWYSQEKDFVELLGEIGPEAKAALPLLKECLDKDFALRRAAAIAIRKIDPEEFTRLGLPGTLTIP